MGTAAGAMSSSSESGSNTGFLVAVLAVAALAFIAVAGWWIFSHRPVALTPVREPVLSQNQRAQFNMALTAIAGLDFSPGCGHDDDLASYARYLMYKALTNGRVPFAGDFRHDYANGCLNNGTRDAFIQMLSDLGAKMRNWGVHSQLSEEELYAVSRWVVQELLTKLH